MTRLPSSMSTLCWNRSPASRCSSTAFTERLTIKLNRLFQIELLPCRAWREARAERRAAARPRKRFERKCVAARRSPLRARFSARSKIAARCVGSTSSACFSALASRSESPASRATAASASRPATASPLIFRLRPSFAPVSPAAASGSSTRSASRATKVRRRHPAAMQTVAPDRPTVKCPGRAPAISAKGAIGRSSSMRVGGPAPERVASTSGLGNFSLIAQG